MTDAVEKYYAYIDATGQHVDNGIVTPEMVQAWAAMSRNKWQPVPTTAPVEE